MPISIKEFLDFSIGVEKLAIKYINHVIGDEFPSAKVKNISLEYNKFGTPVVRIWYSIVRADYYLNTDIKYDKLVEFSKGLN